MPIIIRDFKWKQTKNSIIINVPLKGVHQSKVDIFYSKQYIKANFDQFFFEVLLLHPISVKQSTCTFTPKEMIFELVKIDKSFWENLEPHITKAEKMQLKLELIQEEHARIQENEKEKDKKKMELKRLAVSEQMRIDALIKVKIEEIKKKEQTEALGDLDQWKSTLSLKSRKNEIKQKKKFSKYLAERSSEITIVDSSSSIKEYDLPPLRVSQELEIEFTQRDFPTPMRESKSEEENEWLRKQAVARRSVGFVSEDIRPEEKNPQFLLTKGKEFMKNKNFLGAISAYSFGLKLNDKNVDLYVARSIAHFAQGNYQRSVLDCSTALDLMVPTVQANLKERADCIGRRGMALCKLKLLSKGIGELEASLKLLPNEEYKKFLKEAEKHWMESSDSE